MKRALCLILTVLFCFALFSCAPQTQSAQDPPEVSAPGPAPVEPAPSRVHLFAAGDIVLHESVFLDANRLAGESGQKGSLTESSKYDFAPMFARVASAIALADLAIVNQETLISAQSLPTGYESGFNGPAAAGDCVTALGFDLINILNNHMLDKGTSGLRRSMEYWRAQPVTLLGAYDSKAQSDQICVKEQNGIKIAFLSYLGDPPGTNGNSWDERVYLPLLEESLVREQITRAKELSDCVIVCVHWGIEGTYQLNDQQRSFADLFASLGVDAVIGTHPHVLQPMRWAERPDGGKMLLINSLGDFLSHTQLAGGRNAYGNFLGGYVTFDVVKDDSGVRLEEVRFTPTVSHYDKNEPLDTGFVIYELNDYTDELFARFGDTETGILGVAGIRKIVTSNIPAEFLAEDYR